MTVIRVSVESARQLKFYGKTYEDAVKALLEKDKTGGIDYDKIRKIVLDEVLKVAGR